jgi:hypothetical protein
MTVAIAIGATAFEVINDLLDPALPFPQGERVVAVKYVAEKTAGADQHLLYAFSVWRDNLTTRLRAIGAQLDPALQLRRVVPLSDFYEELRSVWRMMAWGAGIITITVLLLSAAGMHALMSFTIAQRTREIGIRMALGAQPRQLLFGVFGRAMRQLSIGLLVGSLIAIGTFSAAGIGLGPGAALLATVAAVISIVAAFAALGPARRSLRLRPWRRCASTARLSWWRGRGICQLGASRLSIVATSSDGGAETSKGSPNSELLANASRSSMTVRCSNARSSIARACCRHSMRRRFSSIGNVNRKQRISESALIAISRRRRSESSAGVLHT